MKVENDTPYAYLPFLRSIARVVLGFVPSVSIYRHHVIDILLCQPTLRGHPSN